MPSKRINYMKAAVGLVAGLSNKECRELLMYVIQHNPSSVIKSVQGLDNTHKFFQSAISSFIEPAVAFEKEMVSYSKVHNKVASIKKYRVLSDVGLLDAKNYVEDLQRKYGFEFGSLS